MTDTSALDKPESQTAAIWRQFRQQKGDISGRLQDIGRRQICGNVINHKGKPFLNLIQYFVAGPAMFEFSQRGK